MDDEEQYLALVAQEEEKLHKLEQEALENEGKPRRRLRKNNRVIQEEGTEEEQEQPLKESKALKKQFGKGNKPGPRTRSRRRRQVFDDDPDEEDFEGVEEEIKVPGGVAHTMESVEEFFAGEGGGQEGIGGLGREETLNEYLVRMDR